MASALSPIAGLGPSSTRRAFTATHIAPHAPKPLSRRVVVRSSEEDAEAELEKRLEKLRTVKGATPYGQGSKSGQLKPASTSGTGIAAPPPPPKKTYDYTDEKLYYEGPPHRGDLLVNIALGTTLVWLPLTAAAVGRAAFVKYRFTDRRFSIATNAPWKNEQTDIAYQEVKEVVTVGRGVGLWGDMVVTLNDNSKVEMRSLDRFLELKAYILQRRDELGPSEESKKGSGKKGGVVTAAELLGEDNSPATAAIKDKKGFA